MNFKRNLSLIIFLVLFILNNSAAQKRDIFSYNIESGFPSNLIKTIYQDQNGFLWVGSDAGLVRFDGYTITNYTHHLSSHYVKDIKLFDEQSFIVVTDQSIYKVQFENSYYNFIDLSNLLNQQNYSFDFPKSVFIDSHKKIWVSGLQSIFCITNDSIIAYPFSENVLADSYFRSFQIFEDIDETIYAFSWNGSLFKYNLEGNEFILIDNKFNSGNRHIDALLKLPDNRFIAGASDGLFLFSIMENSIQIEQFLPLENVSSIRQADENNFFIGTWGNGVFFSNLAEEQIIPINEVTVKSIKNIYIDNRKSLWVATDEGLILVRDKLFHSIDIKNYYPGFQNLFVRAISGSANTFYFTDTQGLFKAGLVNQNLMIDYLPVKESSQIYSLAAYEDYIWISFMDNTLIQYDVKSQEIIYQITFEEDRAANLFVDSKNDLWAFFEREQKILHIDKSKSLKLYTLHEKDEIHIQVFKEDGEGNLFCSGRGEKPFLFQFDPLNKTFSLVNIDNADDFKGNIIVYDMNILNEKFYLASSRGFYKLQNNRLEKIVLPDAYSLVPVKSVHISGMNQLWLGTDIGLIHIDYERFTYFNKASGLPNSTIVPRGIISDEKGTLWIGTAGGVSYFTPSIKSIERTSSPFITGFTSSIEKEDQLTSLYKTEFLYDTPLHINYVSINFPAHQIKYSYRITGYDNEWSEFVLNQSFLIPKLPVGKYTFEIKALANGMFESETTAYTFSVVPPWFLTIYAYITYIIILLLLIILTTWIVLNYKIKKYKEREANLSLLVEEKTKDLVNEKEKTEKLLFETEKARDELERANELKNQLLSVAAHDLKNPLNSVMCFSSIILEETKDEEVKSMAEMINNSSHKMLQLIIDLLEEAALQSKDIKLNIKLTNISSLVDKTIKEYEIRAEQKMQIIKKSIPEMLLAEVDSIWFVHALENVLSNAIKYSPNNESIFVECKERDDFILISVKDNGPGFSDEDKELLFGKFQRLSAKPTGGETSTGLGLSIVKDIVDKHKGTIEVESEIGKGSTFILSFPISSGNNATRNNNHG